MAATRRWVKAGKLARRYPGAYSSWRGMIQRCYSPTSGNYKYYGARGISVCPEWKSFENFTRDMGERPTAGTLDRIDVDGNYEPGNCRWATQLEQRRNQRRTVMVPYKGEMIPLGHLADQCPHSWKRLYRRIFIFHWPIDEAMSRPRDARGGAGKRKKVQREFVAVRAK